MQQLTAQLKQVQEQLEQAAAALQESEKTISSAKMIVEENRTLKEKLITLHAEYNQKISKANEILGSLGQRTKEYYSDAKEFAGEIAKKRGITNISN